MGKIIYCPQCGNKLEVKIQESLTGKRPPIVLCTCWNKSCKAYSYTLSEETIIKQKEGK